MTASRACNYLQNAAATTYKKFLQFYAKRSCKKQAVIKTNQLVFEAASKSGSDVYNILSTGQLNGLSIALLLSIKNVYGDTKGLDILLIDDPLQTIDDISAISLADLLTQQGIGQIVLSTHEEAKAALLRYKFKHAGMSVREQNMQALYMKTVTEE